MLEGTKNKKGLLKSIRRSVERNKLGEILLRKGLISRPQLKYALEQQKETSAPLGQIFLESALISPWQLRMLLTRQAVLRTAATFFLFGASVSSLNVKTVKAEPLAGVHMTSATAEFTRVAAYPHLLGTSEKKDRNLKAFTKWTGMFSRFDRQLKQQANLNLVRDWQRDIDKLQGRSMKAMVKGVNDLVNKKKYIIDKRN